MLALCEEVSLSLSAFIPSLTCASTPRSSLDRPRDPVSVHYPPYLLMNQILCSGPSTTPSFSPPPPRLIFPILKLSPWIPKLLLSLSRKLGMIFIDESLRATAARRASLLASSSTSNCLKEKREKEKENGNKEKKKSRQREVGKVLFRSLTGQVANTSILINSFRST